MIDFIAIGGIFALLVWVFFAITKKLKEPEPSERKPITPVGIGCGIVIGVFMLAAIGIGAVVLFFALVAANRPH